MKVISKIVFIVALGVVMIWVLMVTVGMIMFSFSVVEILGILAQFASMPVPVW